MPIHAQVRRGIGLSWSFVRKVGAASWTDDILAMAAAVAFYTLLSLAPILVMATAIASIFFRTEALTGELYQQLSRLLGPEAGRQIEAMVAHAQQGFGGVVATMLSVAVLFVGITGVFGQLRSSLNTIWGVKAVLRQGVWGVLRDRLLSFAIFVAVTFVMLVALLVNAVASLASARVTSLVPAAGLVVATVIQLIFEIGLSTCMVAVVMKALPDVRLRFRDLWLGALTTAVLFSVGRQLIGLYIGHSDIGGTYGAASSVVIVLIWVYYSAAVLFLGSEFTRVLAEHRGRAIAPRNGAVRVIRKEVDPDGHEVISGHVAAPAPGERGSDAAAEAGERA